MRRSAFLSLVLALAMAMGVITRCEAEVVWDYEILNNNSVVAPDDSIGAQVRFYNNSTSGEVFQAISAGGKFEINSWAYSSPDEYEYTDEIDNLGSQTVAAGSYLDFRFGLYEPALGNPVLEGDYESNIALVMRRLTWFTPELGYTLVDPQTPNPRVLQWTVTAVPEPATAVLLGIGLVAAVGLSRRLGRDRHSRRDRDSCGGKRGELG